MGSRCDLFCWEIMQCENSDDCPAKKNLEKPCWEIARNSDDYTSVNNICRDCIVHVLKAENTVLSKQQIRKVMDKKTKRHIVSWVVDIQSLQHESY